MILLILSIFLIVGCAAFEKKKQLAPPSVSTGRVIESLTTTKTELQLAGESNTKVAANIDKALTLAQRLDVLLDQIEKEQQIADSKKVINPVK